MSEPKTIKISAVLDVDSFNRVTRAFRDLTNEMQKFAKAAQSAGGFMSGANVGHPGSPSGTQSRAAGQPVNASVPGLGKMVVENANAFKNLASVGASSLRGLTDALRSNVRDQVREVHNLRVSLEALEGQYAQITKAGLSKYGPTATAKQQQIMGVAGQLNTAQGNLTTAQQALNNLNPTPGANASAFSQTLRSILGTYLGPQATNSIIGPSGSLGAAGAVAGVVTGAKLGAGIWQGANNFELDMASKRGSTVRTAYDKTRGVDISDKLALSQWFAKDPSRIERFMLGNDSAVRIASRGIGAAWGTAKGAMTGDFSGLDTTSAQFQETQDQIAKVKDSMEWQMGGGRAISYLDRTRGNRRAASRIAGRGISLNPDGSVRDSYTDWSAGLHQRGYDESESLGALTQARNMGGQRFAQGWAGPIMSANAGGYGGMADAALSSARAGNDLRAMLGGGIGRTAGFGLAGILGGYNGTGAISGMGMLTAIQQQMGSGGLFEMNNGPGDLNMVGRIQSGMQALDRQLGGGADGWTQGQNLLLAMKNMPGGSSYAQDTLANGMSGKELAAIARGDSTVLSRAYGITPEMAQKQFAGSIGNEFSKYVSQGSGDPVERAIQKFQKSGFTGMSKPDLENLAVAYQKGTGSTLEDSILAVGVASGMGGLDEKGNFVGTLPGAGRLDSESAAKAKAEAEQIRKDGQTVTDDVLKTITNLYGANGIQQKAVESLGLAAGEFAQSIAEFGRYVEVLTGHKLLADTSQPGNRLNSAQAGTEPNSHKSRVPR